MARLRLEALIKTFPQRPEPVRAVDSLTLQVEDGELLVLLGPSGCGKTTTLRMISGLEDASSGEIFLDDQPVTLLPPRDRKISMVFQSPALYPQLRVRENLGLGLKLRGMAGPEVTARVRETAGLLGLSELLERYPAELSGGEAQRVALGRALVTQPSVFLLDEPLSSLDNATRVQLRAEIKKIQRETRVPMIYVTHDQQEAMALGDRIAVMNRGQLQQAGTPREIYYDPANVFTATFVGTPAMNLVRGRVTGGLLECDGFAMPIPGGIETRGDLMAGIRPEDVLLGSGDIAARVVQVTPAFPHAHVYLEAGGEILCATVPGEEEFVPGQRLFAGFRANRVLLFDPATGERIRARS